MPAANSLRFNILPSNIPALPPNLDGEAAFVINGVSEGMIVEGTPFTTTSFNDFETLGVKFANTADNAILPEHRNNNLLLQAKAFYDIAGEGARVHWLVLNNERYESVSYDSDRGARTEEAAWESKPGIRLTDIFDTDNADSQFKDLVMHAQRRIRLLGVSFARKNSRTMFAEDSSGNPVEPDNELPVTAVYNGAGDTDNKFAGDIGHDEIKAIDDEAAEWEEEGMPFLAVIGADYEGNTTYGASVVPTIDFTDSAYRRSSVVVGGNFVRELEDGDLTTGVQYDNLTNTQKANYQSKAPVGLCLGSLYTRRVEESLVKVASGPIPSLDQTNAFTANAVSQNLTTTRANALNLQRYVYLRTYPTQSGVFWATDSLVNAINSPYESTMPERRVVGKAMFLVKGYLDTLQGMDLFLTSVGRLTGEEIDLINGAVNGTLETSLINVGNVSNAIARLVSDIDFRVDPRIVISINVSPKGIAKTIEVNVGRNLNG